MSQPPVMRQLSFTNPYLKRMTQQQQQPQSKPINTQKQHQQQPLSRITQTPQQYQQSTKQNFQNTNYQCCNQFWTKQNLINYSYQWILFIIAFIVFLLIWVTGHFSIQRLTSYYYLNEFNVSPYANIQYWRVTNQANNITVYNTAQNYIKSNTLYTTTQQLKTADAIALSLVFSWLMWKLPLTIFTLSIIITTRRQQSQINMLHYATWGFYMLLLLLIDIMTTIFRPQGYQDWIYFVVYFVLSIVLIVINSFGNRKKRVIKIKLLYKNLTNYLLPILYIIIAYACFTILIPAIYHSIYNGINQDAAYIIVHIFPFIDIIFFSLIILITYYSNHHTIKFTKHLHFLNTGYAIGHVILFSPQDVEFYYLCVYFVIRNFVFNWVVKNVQKYIIVPVPVPGWIMIYLVSLATNFIPFTGLGKLVVSRSFYSQILQLTLPIQSYKLPIDYFVYYNNNLSSTTMSTFNPSLNTNIQISSVFIIWVLLSVTQKYHVSSKVEWKEIFFYIFGIYMFYFGLTTGSQLFYLQANSL